MTIRTKANIFFWTLLAIVAAITVACTYDDSPFTSSTSDEGQLLTDTEAGYNPSANTREQTEEINGQNQRPSP